jgi:hypothetical protein
MVSSPGEVGDATELCRDSGSCVVPTVSSILRFKNFNDLTLLNAKDPTTFIVWWLHFKAVVFNKQGFTEFWTAAATCYAQHHASVLSILSQISQDNQAKTKLLRSLSSDDPQRGRRAVDALLATFLPSPKSRSAILNHAMYLTMQRAEDMADYENWLNLVRMELEQQMKPPD